MNLGSVQYIDISPTVWEKTAVYPGDRPYLRNVEVDFDTGGNMRLSNISSTVHIGAHVDAPNHYHPEGEGIDSRDLKFYLGPAQVIEVNIPKGERIYPQNFSEIEICAPRVLFKTRSFSDPDRWRDDFNSLSPETIIFLKEKNVVLVGIDTPSVDPANDEALLTHKEIYRCNMAILEGVYLEDVDPGNYQLIALPLKLKGADASPVRAVLLKESS